MAEEEHIIITQNEGDRLRADHSGGLAIYGDAEQAALKHEFGGQVIHTTVPEQPLVHMICWGEEEPCEVKLDHTGRVILAGDQDAPFPARMTHHFENVHKQAHVVEPLEHTLAVNTQLSQPIHHAVQMRTPLQLRFCNPWHVASDYVLEVNLGKRRLISLRLTGATVATPQPCEDEAPPPPAVEPITP